VSLSINGRGFVKNLLIEKEVCIHVWIFSRKQIPLLSFCHASKINRVGGRGGKKPMHFRAEIFLGNFSDPLGLEEGIAVFLFSRGRKYGRGGNSGKGAISHFSFHFHYIVDWTTDKLSFGLRWQRKRQEFSADIQIWYIRCRFHPTVGFSYQRKCMGN
jgi:hypothetical protein